MTMQYFKKMQAEQAEWSKKNFGDGPKHWPLLGVIEELGEFYEALASQDESKACDAIGDIVIYMSDVCTKWCWDLQDLFDNKFRGGPICTISWFQGRLAHHQLKFEQNIRKNEDHEMEIRHIFSAIFEEIYLYCAGRNKDFIEVVDSVWAKVSKRDWVQNPDTAHEVAEASE